VSPSVSIVIPTYKNGRFLAEAIESALAQTCPCEIIVVCDGPLQDLGFLVSRYGEVEFIQQPHRGVSAARNNGWRAARGHYVVFLDGDDRLKPNAVELNLQRFAEHPGCAFVYGSFQYIDSDGYVLKSPYAKEIGEDAYGALLREDTIVTTATVMHRRDCLEAVGGFDEQLACCEDYDLYLRLARRYQIARSAGCLCEYRRHPGNLSSNIPLMLRSFLEVMRRQEKYCVQSLPWQRAMEIGIRDFKQGYAAEQLYQVRDVVKASGLRKIPVGPIIEVVRLAPLSVTKVVYWSILKKLHTAYTVAARKYLSRR
jgi:glycosyltransferase involved in cell wall biosynthesis